MSTSYANGIQVFNAALLRLGEEETQTNAGTPEARLFRATFDRMAETQLAKHAAGFARRTAPLFKQGETGDTPKYAYGLPADYKLAHKATVNASPIHYEIRGGKLLTDVDSDAIRLHYTWAAPVNQWSPAFAEAMVVRMEALILSLYERSVDSRERHKKADEMFLDAQAIDRNQMSDPDHTPAPKLVRAWRGGGRHGYGRSA